MSVFKWQEKQKFGADKENNGIHECDELDNQRNKWIYIIHFIWRGNKTLWLPKWIMLHLTNTVEKWSDIYKWSFQITGAYPYKIKTFQFNHSN